MEQDLEKNGSPRSAGSGGADSEEAVKEALEAVVKKILHSKDSPVVFITGGNYSFAEHAITINYNYGSDYVHRSGLNPHDSLRLMEMTPDERRLYLCLCSVDETLFCISLLRDAHSNQTVAEIVLSLVVRGLLTEKAVVTLDFMERIRPFCTGLAKTFDPDSIRRHYHKLMETRGQGKGGK